MDTLETQLLFETSMVKSPALAAIVGFFVPAVAAFYTGRIGTGMLYPNHRLLESHVRHHGYRRYYGLPVPFAHRSSRLWVGQRNESEAVGTHHGGTEREANPGSRSGRSVRSQRRRVNDYAGI